MDLNVKEELVKNIMRRGLLGKKYENRAWNNRLRRLDRGDINYISNDNFNNTQKETLEIIQQYSSKNIKTNDQKSIRNKKLQINQLRGKMEKGQLMSFLMALPIYDLRKIRGQVTNIHVPYDNKLPTVYMNSNKVDMSRMKNKQLTSIPKVIFTMKKIKELNLSNNKLKTLPDSIGNLETLITLNLSNNILETLPTSIGNLKNLRTLNVYSNKLKTLPTSIGNLKNLEYIELFNNKLKTLPDSIGKLVNLKRITVGHNEELKTLPESIGNLTKLEELNLIKTQITKLPESIGRLKNLKKLVLDDTITEVPDSFRNLPETLIIQVGNRELKKSDFWFKYRLNRKIYRINNTTNFFNNSLSTSSMRNIPPNKRAFIKIMGEVKSNGTLRRVYNMNFLKSYPRGILHSGTFEKENIKLVNSEKVKVNKSAYIKNIKNHLSNVSLNNFNKAIENVKKNLPSNVNRTDVNVIVRSMKPQLLQKILNKMKNSPINSRSALLNNYKNRGLINSYDIANIRNKL